MSSPRHPREPSGDRPPLRVAEAHIRECAEKIERGEAVPEDPSSWRSRRWATR